MDETDVMLFGVIVCERSTNMISIISGSYKHFAVRKLLMLLLSCKIRVYAFATVRMVLKAFCFFGSQSVYASICAS